MTTDVERRVRDALAARAAQITAERLQPAMPPTLAGAGSRSPRHRLGWWTAGLALALAGAAVVVVTLRPTPPVQEPATPPASVVPSPSVSEPPSSEPPSSPLPAKPEATPSEKIANPSPADPTASPRRIDTSPGMPEASPVR